MPRPLSDLETALGHRFSRSELLEQALTHSSFANESESQGGGSVRDNEQLEFLGDSILGFVTAQYLFERYPDYSEAELHKLRAHIVSARHLLRIAQELELGSHLRLGRGEENSGGRQKSALLVDSLEAILAALALDAGDDAALSVARAFITERIIAPELARMAQQPESVFDLADQKSALQERLRELGRPEAEFFVIGETGPDHEKTFNVELRIPDDSGGVHFIVRAEGHSKKEAQRRAAEQALARLERAAPGQAATERPATQK